MPKYNGVIPTDLEKRDTVWTHEVVGPKQRVIAAKLAGLIPPYGPVAVAITMIEQPDEIPNNNATGMMPWKKTFPWGWSAKKFENVSPCGYFTCGEGTSDKVGVFFAFARLSDSIRLCAETCRKRGIVDGKSYVKIWVAGNPDNTTTDEYFDKILAKIERLWAYLDSTLVGPGV
jgi:hypothetical protein